MSVIDFKFGKSNYITEDLNYLYHSIYEEDKVDRNEDEVNNFADVMIARMIASGMPKEEAIRRTRNKLYNRRGENLKEAAPLIPIVARVAAPLVGRFAGGVVARGVGSRIAGGAASGGLRAGLGDKIGNLAGRVVGNAVEKRVKKIFTDNDENSDEESQNESLTYDVLEYLIDEGYADSLENALSIFENMSEEWIGYIIEREDSPYEKASDAALDARYGYGRATGSKRSFGRAANRASAAAILRRMRRDRDEGRTTSRESGADAVHQGWAHTARTSADQTPEKKERRAKLADTPYSKLPNDEQEKDRVSADAVRAVYNRRMAQRKP